MEILNKVKNNVGVLNTYQDIIRVTALGSLCLVLFYPDLTTLSILQYVFGFQIAIALMSHVSRKLLFPYVDLKEYFESAKREPLASSIAILSISLILSTFIYASAQFFNK